MLQSVGLSQIVPVHIACKDTKHVCPANCSKQEPHGHWGLCVYYRSFRAQMLKIMARLINMDFSKLKKVLLEL